ncbi:MAG: ABC transporter permease [Candidatus Saliniplasma sp.]
MNERSIWEKIKKNKSVRILREEIYTVSGYKVIIGLVIVLFYVGLAIAAPLLATHDPTQLGAGPDLETPSGEFFFGTTDLGQDLYSRILFGTRTALTVVLLATAIAMSIGIPLGLISGYVGGKGDRVTLLVMDAMYSFPSIVLAILVVVALEPGILPASAAVSVVYIPQYFRIIRNHVMSIKNEAFVKSAKAVGSSKKDTILKYILPNVSQSIPVILTLNAADGILTLAGLSFLGLGVQPPNPSWGYDLNSAWSLLSIADNNPQVWYYSLIPGVAIVLLIVGFTLLGEGLNDILNPQLREGKRQ